MGLEDRLRRIEHLLNRDAVPNWSAYLDALREFGRGWTGSTENRMDTKQEGERHADTA